MAQPKFREIDLVAPRASWGVNIYHGSALDKDMKDLRAQILKRDGGRCYFCGFTSDHFQEVHHLDHDHDNVNKSNLVAVCPICHQDFHLLSASVTGGGRIIYMPEISQVSLNHLCRQMFIFMYLSLRAQKQNQVSAELDLLAASVKGVRAILDSRSEIVDSYLAPNASDPARFAEALLLMEEGRKGKSALREDKELGFGGVPIKTLRQFKLLPSLGRFSQAIKHWAKTASVQDAEEWLEEVPRELVGKVFEEMAPI